MVRVETEPHPETLESLFAEPVFQPVEDVGLGFGSLAIPVVTDEQRAFTAAQEIDCADETVQTAGQEADLCQPVDRQAFRSVEHTSELQSLMRISYAVFCLKK